MISKSTNTPRGAVATNECGFSPLIETNGLDLQTILLEEFNPKVTEKIVNMQDTLNDLLLGDHYRVFFKKPK